MLQKLGLKYISKYRNPLLYQILLLQRASQLHRIECFLRECRHKIKAYERHEHNKDVNVSAVDIAPEDCERNDQPYIEDISICGQNKNEHKNGHKKI